MSKSLPLDLSSRHALITGASGAIGNAIASAFEAYGATCVRSDIDASARVLPCDVTDENAVAYLFERSSADTPLTDVIHAAGILSNLAPIAETTLETFRSVIEVNLTGTFVVAREAARRLQRGGVITLISSQAGLKGGAAWGAYSASKGGVHRLVDCMAEELGPTGVRINAVCPGGVKTPMLENASEQLSFTDNNPSAVMESYTSDNPLRRLAEPEDIADACVFLSSHLASYVHGTAQVVDGGELTR